MEPLDPNKRFNITYTWTQPYEDINFVYNTQNPSTNPVYNQQLERELDLLDTIDLIVDTMTDYSDARKLLKGILK